MKKLQFYCSPNEDLFYPYRVTSLRSLDNELSEREKRHYNGVLNSVYYVHGTRMKSAHRPCTPQTYYADQSVIVLINVLIVVKNSATFMCNYRRITHAIYES